MLWDLDCTCRRYEKAGSLLHEMSVPYSQDSLAGPCAEHRHFLSDRSQSCSGSNRPSLQLTFWTCSPTSTSRGHTCPKLCGATSVCHSVAFQTRLWDNIQTALRTGGLTNSAGTMVHLLLTSGDKQSHVDTRGWRCGPWQLCINDDNDISVLFAAVHSQPARASSPR